MIRRPGVNNRHPKKHNPMLIIPSVQKEILYNINTAGGHRHNLLE
jgi:hypothetical protein